MNQVFIGKSIEQELRLQERSVVWLARKLNCNRTNVYKIFNRTTIDTELLLKISNVLQRNFFEEYTCRLDFNKESEA
ncbi:MAG: XRE family transcriptional regulator [Paramuribaculum sp.]|nr:XRE family transcriptional regulator [Paramuribaculum sp.]